MLSFTACSEDDTSLNSEYIESVIDEIQAESEETDDELMTEADDTLDTDENNDEETTNDSGIDVDLTTLSSTMVFAEVYNMLFNSDDYIGLTIKMNGMFALYQDSATGQLYFATIVQDATACCAQGIEFILAGDDNIYPDDYPELGSDITVIGEFDVYDENGVTYCTLREAYFE